jgi:hypothetical protein
MRRYTIQDRLALGISIVTVIAVYFVAIQVYEGMPHFEDEMAYVWQGQAIAGGQLLLPSSPQPKSFLIPFVVEHDGMRSSKYPPGWPAILAVGILTGTRNWINPVLAGFGIWLCYLLGKRVVSDAGGLVGMLLMISSPMFWLLSGSLLSHAWSLVLTLGFVLAWLDTFFPEGNQAAPSSLVAVSTSGLCLGVLALTRPVTALAVGAPFLLHGLWILVFGRGTNRRRVLVIGVIAFCLALLLLAWSFAVTGDALQNPYTLWWKYDKYGFGQGFGRSENGHDLESAWSNIKYSLRAYGTGGDLLGWGDLWWILLPFGAWVLLRKPAGLLVAGLFPATVLVYVPYWIGSWQYGPRYYYEGMLTITVFSAAGICWLVGDGWRIRRFLAVLALIVLVGHNLSVYLPARVSAKRGMYGIQRAMLEPFKSIEAQNLTPALVIVSYDEKWTQYGGLLELQNAQLTTPFIFILNRGSAANADVMNAFPDRKVIYYYTDEPYQFYDSPR